MSGQERSEFERASALERLGNGRFRAHVPDGWQQGRGAFGGLVLGLLARAMEADEEGGRRLRTLSGDICGPVLAGDADVQVRVLRRGANQTNLAAELVQEGQTLATATAVFSTPRSAQTRMQVQPEAPQSVPWEELSPLPVEPPLGPAFARHYEYRSAGPFPYSGHHEAITAGWIRERQPPAQLDAPALIARLDAWWPALLSCEETPRMAATISFVAEILVDPRTLDAAQPLAHRARVAALADGFFVEFRELWSGTTLVALNQQTFALIR